MEMLLRVLETLNSLMRGFDVAVRDFVLPFVMMAETIFTFVIINLIMPGTAIVSL